MKIKKSSIIIMAVIAVLIIMIAVLAALNYNDAKARAERLADAAFIIQAGGQSFTVDYEMLKDAGIQEFTADKRSGGKPAVTINYQGVPLKNLCEKLEIEVANCTAYAADGYAVGVSADKINDAENVYIALDNDDGPYVLVVVKDPFSQYWCKYLSEIVFK